MARVTQKIAVYFLLIIAGLFVLFKFYWAQELTRWLAFGGFILSSYFLIKLIIELTNLLYPSTQSLSLSILFNKEKFKKLKSQTANAGKKAWIFLIIVIVTSIVGISAWLISLKCTN
ncbi:MAG: hypothetical protein V4685_00430 [Bacteroidota bacterium]